MRPPAVAAAALLVLAGPRLAAAEGAGPDAGPGATPAAGRWRTALGVDYYRGRPARGDLDLAELPTLSLSVTGGDEHALDAELRLSTIVIGGLAEVGARLYVAPAPVALYVFGRGGVTLITVAPSDLTVAGGVGAAIALGERRRLELEVGAYACFGGEIAQEAIGRGARISGGVRF